MLLLLLKGLACYRLTNLLVFEPGPNGILHAMRSDLGAYDLGRDGEPDTELGKLLSCPYCAGIWIALFLALLPYRPFKFLFWWLGIAGFQFALQRSTGGIND